MGTIISKRDALEWFKYNPEFINGLSKQLMIFFLHKNDGITQEEISCFISKIFDESLCLEKLIKRSGLTYL